MDFLKYIGDDGFRDVSVYVGVDHGVKGGQGTHQRDAADTRLQPSGVQENYGGGSFGAVIDLFAVHSFVVWASLVMMLLSRRCGKDDRNIEGYRTSDFCSAEAFPGQDSSPAQLSA